MKNIYMVKNLFGYEEIASPPLNLPKEIITVYLTDNTEAVDLAKSLGWDLSISTNKFINAQTEKDKRMAVAYINCFPNEFIPNDIEYKLIFISDSDVISLFDDYVNFADKCDESYCLFITSGYYANKKDNIKNELIRSKQERWKNFYRDIEERTTFYLSEFQKINIDYKNVSVSSAKYIGWNPRHEKFSLLSNVLYEEYKKNIQGNIVLSYLKKIYPEIILDYYTENYRNGKTRNHKHYDF